MKHSTEIGVVKEDEDGVHYVTSKEAASLMSRSRR